MTKELLTRIFNHDFTQGQVRERFFAHALALADLRLVCDAVCAGSIAINGRAIPAAIRIPGKTGGPPFVILAQLHGNEPAGLAGIALALALQAAGLLEHDVIGMIGNPLAAKQYFDAWAKAPHDRQQTRDAYRCGLSESGTLLPDMNRIPVDFLSREPSDHHTRRAQELYAVAQHAWGILDIHSARGNMLCVTDHERDADLRHSPIRSVLTGLADAISAHASASVTVRTFKTIAVALPNIESETGIEAGRHEAPEAPYNAAAFTLSLLHTLGITSAATLPKEETGVFERYAVRPRITYADLDHAGTLRNDDRIHMAKACHALASVPARSDTVIVKRGDGHYALQSVAEFTHKPLGSMEFAVYQYDEMEAIDKGAIVAVAIPSGTVFKTKEVFSGIFFSKSAALYDKDPAVGPWPVAADKIGSVKFCYPCEVSKMRIDFD